MKDNLNIKGEVTISRHGHDDIVVQNLVVDTGLGFYIGRILDTTEDIIEHISIGNGTTEASASDTALAGAQTHSINYRNLSALTVNSFVVESFFDDATYDTNSVNEIGLFTNTNTLIARVVLPVNQRFIKTSGEHISVSWKITIGA